MSTVGKEARMPRIERDGVRLAYEQTGAGAPALLLIHGAFANRSAYDLQVDHFASSHEVVRVDMRGHGESDRPEGPYSIPEFADDVAYMARELGLRDAVVVGHSMGGLVAVEMAGHHADVVGAVVTLDSPSLIPGWSNEFAHPIDDEMEGANVRDVLEAFLRRAEHPADDHARWDQSLASVRELPEHVIRATWAALEWDPAPALRACQVPFLYLDHGQPGYDLTELRALCPQVASGQTVGAGHRALQDVPDQVNAMLERFIDKRHVIAEFELQRARGS
jgi:pimeloyl-ACP methyl ester carboxylesterase